MPTVAEIAALIDHAILKPELTRAEVDAQLDEARESGVFSVCVRP
ncbi:deoxyribose-phosphate aldolase, partial [Rathayibacter sp. AY1D7]